jgi:hypothetical protein
MGEIIMANYSPERIQSYLDQINNFQTSSQERGRALENFTEYLFTRIPGVSLEDRNFMNNDQTEEIDLALWNRKNNNGLHFLDAIILVECKNTQNAIGSRDVQWFITKINDKAQKFGILISANGISGSPVENDAAHSIVRNNFIAHKIVTIIISRNEIENLLNTNELVELIRSKYLSLILRGVIS